MADSGAVVKKDQAVQTRGDFSDFTPEGFKAKMDREKKMREILISYVRSEMKEGHHYYTFGGSKDKPSLKKEGAHNLIGLYNVRPEYDQTVEHLDNGHFNICVKCRLYSLKSEKEVAQGEGAASSMEPKYKYRWVPKDEVPKKYNADDLPKKWVFNKPKFRVENEDPYELFNTLVKMADKRACVAAASHLPIVSELFTQDVEDMPNLQKEKKQEKEAKKEDLSAGVKEAGGETQTQGGGASEIRLSFGKHNGKTLDEIPSDYLKWLSDKAKDKDVRQAAKDEYSRRSNPPGEETEEVKEGEVVEEEEIKDPINCTADFDTCPHGIKVQGEVICPPLTKTRLKGRCKYVKV
jgi:hypothetical protein